MPIRKLSLKPGVNVELSETANQFQLADSNLVRFYSGVVQKLGGWERLTSTPFIGTCRGLHGWADIDGDSYLAIGTNERLQLFNSGIMDDLTPIAQISNPAVSLTAVSGSSTITVLDNIYNPLAGQWLYLATQMSVGGVSLFGYYKVVDVPDGTHYTITMASPSNADVASGGATALFTATSGSATVSVLLPGHGYVTGFGGVFDALVSTTFAGITISGLYAVASVVDPSNFTIIVSGVANVNATASMNAGLAQFRYLLAPGAVVNMVAGGYGAGDYGGGDYGGSGLGAFIKLRQWSLDHFGQDLIASPNYGAIYYWQPDNVVPATLMPNAPAKNISVLVIGQAQIIMGLGCEIGGVLQPGLARWCSVGDFTDWTASAINQAGSYFIPSGSGFVGGLSIGLGALIWTDIDVWSVTYLGFPLVFGFNRLSPGCGLISQRAVGAVGGLVMWLSTDQFARYQVGGGVTPIECSVWDFYRNNVDLHQFEQIHCAVNTIGLEMAWHFPVRIDSPIYNPATPMAYVKFNYVENVWDKGMSRQYQRTAWAGHSPVADPVGADLNSLLQQHENGLDADGAAMEWSWQTGYVDLAEGEEFAFADMLWPDFRCVGTPTMIPRILMKDAPNAPVVDAVIPPFSSLDHYLNFSARARQLALGMAGSPSDLGTHSRLGAIRIRVQPDGRN